MNSTNIQVKNVEDFKKKSLVQVRKEDVLTKALAIKRKIIQQKANQIEKLPLEAIWDYVYEKKVKLNDFV